MAGRLVRRQLVQVLVHRLVRLDLVLDAVDAGHQHGRERQVRVGRRVRHPELQALGLGVRAGDRDAHAGRPVALGVDQVDRRLVAGHQAVVGVHRRVGEREQRGCVLEQAAHVVPAGVGQARVAHLVVEERRAVLPDALVAVHAGAVVTEDRLGHERGGLARRPRDALHHVLVEHQVVGLLEQRAEQDVDLRLARGADLVVLHLHRDADLDQLADHLRAQVGVVVDRRDREVAALVRGLGAEVPAFLLTPGVPGALDRVDVVVASVGPGVVAHRVEDVELRLRAEERGVPDPGALEERLGLAGDVPRVTGVRLAGQRVVHEEGQVQGRVLAERVHDRAGRVGHQEHVRLVDLLEPPDRGAVEHAALGEDLVVERLSRDREVLDRPEQVTEPDIDELNLCIADELQYLVGVVEHQPSLNGAGTALAGTCCLPGLPRLKAAQRRPRRSWPLGGSACGRNVFGR